MSGGVYLQRQNGSMPAEPVPPHLLIQVVAYPIHRQITIGVPHIALAPIAIPLTRAQHRQLDHIHQTHGACMICMVMYGSGVQIGTELIQPQLKLTPQALLRARTEWFVAAVGTSSLGFAALPFATTTTRTTASAI